MRDVKKRICLSILAFMLCGITGCEKMEHGPALNLPKEATEVWLTQVYAEVESSVQEVEVVKSDTEQMLKEAQGVVAEAQKLVEELEQDINHVAEGKKRQDEGKVGIGITEVEGTEKDTAGEAFGEAVTEQNGTEAIQDGGPEEALKQTYEFTYSEKAYFADALFIGDSRTKGLELYGTFDNADYFAEPGLSLYTLAKTKLEVGEYGKLKLEELLEKEQYGKIYLMLGINELGYNFDTTVQKYQDLVTQLRQQQPDAILYVCANLHVTEVRDEHDEIHNNTNIDKINAYIATMADAQEIFYLDVNALFDDAEGNLDKEIASDDSHVRVAAYEDWCNWLKENTIVK